MRICKVRKIQETLSIEGFITESKICVIFCFRFIRESARQRKRRQKLKESIETVCQNLKHQVL